MPYRKLSSLDLFEHFVLVIIPEWRVADQQDVEDHTTGPHIHCIAVWVFTQDLRGQVTWGTCKPWGERGKYIGGGEDSMPERTDSSKTELSSHSHSHFHTHTHLTHSHSHSLSLSLTLTLTLTLSHSLTLTLTLTLTHPYSHSQSHSLMLTLTHSLMLHEGEETDHRNVSHPWPPLLVQSQQALQRHLVPC